MDTIPNDVSSGRQATNDETPAMRLRIATLFEDEHLDSTRYPYIEGVRRVEADVAALATLSSSPRRIRPRTSGSRSRSPATICNGTEEGEDNSKSTPPSRHPRAARTGSSGNGDVVKDWPASVVSSSYAPQSTTKSGALSRTMTSAMLGEEYKTSRGSPELVGSGSSSTLDGSDTEDEDIETMPPVKGILRTRTFYRRSKAFAKDGRNCNQSSTTSILHSPQPSNATASSNGDDETGFNSTVTSSVVNPYDSEDEDEIADTNESKLRLDQRTQRRQREEAQQMELRVDHSVFVVAQQARDADWRVQYVKQGRQEAIDADLKAGKSVGPRIDSEVVMENSPALRAAVQILRHQVLAGTLDPFELKPEDIRAAREAAESQPQASSPLSRKRKREANCDDDKERVVRRRLSARQEGGDDIPVIDALSSDQRKPRSVLVDRPIADAAQDGVSKARIKRSALHFASVARSQSGTIMEPELEANKEDPSTPVDMEAVRLAEAELDPELVRYIITLIEG